MSFAGTRDFIDGFAKFFNGLNGLLLVRLSAKGEDWN